MLLKRFVMALAIALYSVVPVVVVAGDSDRVRGHWRGHSAKMLNVKAHQQTAWGHLEKAHLDSIRASARDLRLMKKRRRIAFQGSAGEEGLISRYKRDYQIAIGRNLTSNQRPFVCAPSHRFPMGLSKGSGMRWNKGVRKGWGGVYGKNSNRHSGMGRDKGAGKRADQSRGDKWQKYRKKKSFDSD